MARQWSKGALYAALIAAAVVLAVVLLWLPPVSMGGFAVWFVATPLLILGYFVPFRYYAATLLVFASAIYFSRVWIIGHGVIVVYVTVAVLLAVPLWRRIVGRDDALLVTVAMLLLSMPVMSFLYQTMSDVSVEYARLATARVCISLLFAIVLGELILTGVALTPNVQAGIQQFTSYQPSLRQLVELILGVSVSVFIGVLLSMFWSDARKTMFEEVSLMGNGHIATYLGLQSSTFTSQMHGLQVLAPPASPDAVNQLNAIVGSVASLSGEGFLDHPFALVYDDLVSAPAGVDPNEVLAARDIVAERYAGSTVAHALRSEALSVYAHVLLGQENQPDIVSLHDTYDEALHHEGLDMSLPIAELVTVLPTFGDAEPGTLALSDLLSIGRISFANRATGGGFSLMRYRNEDGGFTVPVAVTASESVVSRYQDRLYGVEDLKVVVDLEPSLIRAITQVSSRISVALAILFVLLIVVRLVVGRLVEPLESLPARFGRWQSQASVAGSTTQLFRQSPLAEIATLEREFQGLAEEILLSDKRLLITAEGYYRLLESLPLGVLAISKTEEWRFINPAMEALIGGDPDFSEQLIARAKVHFREEDSLSEWTYREGSRESKSMLLAVIERMDSQGEPSGMWIVVADLTEQRQTTAQLIQASKLATLGEMSTGMAHEINQPLNVISLATSNMRFAAKKGPIPTDALLTKIGRIDEAVQRAATIIDHMRAYGRLSGEGLSRVDVGSVAEGSCKLLAEQLRLSSIELINDVAPGNVFVTGNAIQLEQVIINLVSNAKDAIRGSANEGSIRIWHEIDGDFVDVHVTDSGGGIPEDVLPHIFEPFFTTKPVGQGTGLGGSISYGIVREMQGELLAENVEGGAQITVRLPLSQLEEKPEEIDVVAALLAADASKESPE